MTLEVPPADPLDPRAELVRRAAMTVDGGFDLQQISGSRSAGRRERHAR
jgi:hypothetical protein